MALDNAAQIWDSKRVLIPAVFQAGPRRGTPIVPGDGSSYNGTVRVTQSILSTLMNQELFIYGLTEPVPGDEPHRMMVGRITLSDCLVEDMPLATVQLDPAVAAGGVANDFDLFAADFGDDLIGPEPPYQDAVARLNAYVGTFSSESRIADAVVDPMIGITATARVASKCPLSCMGYFVGACKCYWDKADKEWACGKKKTITAAGCVGWCPG
jgi:hypothetical protein